MAGSLAKELAKAFRSLRLSLLALASSAAAGEIQVPGDRPNLQAAIDAASPGDVITVSTAFTQEPVVVDKALTILGDPVLNVRVRCTEFGGLGNGFTLAGPGGGRVVIGNVEWSSLDCSHPGSAIGGGGFDELHVFHGTYLPHHGATGVGDSASSIQVSVPYVLIEGSEIRGGHPDSDHCSGSLPSGVYAAIEAPSSSVTVLASTITGGQSFHYCCEECTCPATLPSGGEGGHGIVAQEVFVDAASVVTGGVGATYEAFPLFEGSSWPPPVECGKKADGQAFVAGVVHQLPGVIAGSGATPLGGTFTLSFDVPGPLAVLFASAGATAAPSFLPGAGYVFLTAPVFAGPLPAGGPQSVSFAVPPVSALLGLEGGFQIFDATLGLTAPAVGVLGP